MGHARGSAIRAAREAGGGQLEVLRAPHVSAHRCMFLFWIWHGVASIKLILEVMARAEIIIFQNGTLKPLKWYNVQTIFKLANLFYYFIQNIVKIWTK
jgi:hypothetical protein